MIKRQEKMNGEMFFLLIHPDKHETLPTIQLMERIGYSSEQLTFLSKILNDISENL